MKYNFGFEVDKCIIAVDTEVLLPSNRATANHPGVIAQFHLYFDDLFLHSLGAPIVDWFKT